MTHGPISCTKFLVRVSRTRNLDRLPSALAVHWTDNFVSSCTSHRGKHSDVRGWSHAGQWHGECLRCLGRQSSRGRSLQWWLAVRTLPANQEECRAEDHRNALHTDHETAVHTITTHHVLDSHTFCWINNFKNTYFMLSETNNSQNKSRKCWLLTYCPGHEI